MADSFKLVTSLQHLHIMITNRWHDVNFNKSTNTKHTRV